MGTLYNQDMLTFEILKLIEKKLNWDSRNLSILGGGEPLCKENREPFVNFLLKNR